MLTSHNPTKKPPTADSDVTEPALLKAVEEHKNEEFKSMLATPQGIKLKDTPYISHEIINAAIRVHNNEILDLLRPEKSTAKRYDAPVTDDHIKTAITFHNDEVFDRFAKDCTPDELRSCNLLSRVIQSGTPGMVKTLLNKGEQPTPEDFLHAVEKHRNENIEKILSHLEAEKPQLSLAFLDLAATKETAIKYRNLFVIQKYIACCSPAKLASDAFFMLPLAIKSGTPEIVKTLLDAGMQPTEKDLQLAAERKGAPGIMDMLHQAGHKTDKFHSPSVETATPSSTNPVQTFSSLQEPGESWQDALQRRRIVQESKHSSDILNLRKAIKELNTEKLTEILSIPEADELIKEMEQLKLPPLAIAIEANNLDAFKLLLPKSDVKAPCIRFSSSGSNDTYLVHVAIEHDAAEMLSMLIEKGASVEQSDKDYSPLSRAIHRGHMNSVNILLDKGASPANIHRRFNALGMALACNREEIAQMLIKRGVELPGEQYAILNSEQQKVFRKLNKEAKKQTQPFINWFRKGGSSKDTAITSIAKNSDNAEPSTSSQRPANQASLEPASEASSSHSISQKGSSPESSKISLRELLAKFDFSMRSSDGELLVDEPVRLICRGYFSWKENQPWIKDMYELQSSYNANKKELDKIDKKLLEPASDKEKRKQLLQKKKELTKNENKLAKEIEQKGKRPDELDIKYNETRNAIKKCLNNAHIPYNDPIAEQEFQKKMGYIGSNAMKQEVKRAVDSLENDLAKCFTKNSPAFFAAEKKILESVSLTTSHASAQPLDTQAASASSIKPSTSPSTSFLPKIQEQMRQIENDKMIREETLNKTAITTSAPSITYSIITPSTATLSLWSSTSPKREEEQQPLPNRKETAL